MSDEVVVVEGVTVEGPVLGESGATAGGDVAGAGATPGGPPPAVFVVVGEPYAEGQKKEILDQLSMNLKRWDEKSSGLDIYAEFEKVVHEGVKPVVNEDGEAFISYSSPRLTITFLIAPRFSTALSHLHTFLRTPCAYRRVIYAGASPSGGPYPAWQLRDGSLGLETLTALFKLPDVIASIRPDSFVAFLDEDRCHGDWNPAAVSALIPASSGGKIQTRVAAIKHSGNVFFLQSFIHEVVSPLVAEYASASASLFGGRVLRVATADRPTLHVFPAGQGTSTTFGVDGFNLLVGAGASRVPACWELARHVARFDALIIPHLGADGVFGARTFLEKLAAGGGSPDEILPELGVVYCNVGSTMHDAKEKCGSPVAIDLADETREIIKCLDKINVRALPCVGDDKQNAIKSTNLYYKIGSGSVDMFVVHPTTSGAGGKVQEVKGQGKDRAIAAIVVWKSAKQDARPLRVLFVDNVPVRKLFEGLDKLKAESIFHGWTGTETKAKATPAGGADKKGKPVSGKVSEQKDARGVTGEGKAAAGKEQSTIIEKKDGQNGQHQGGAKPPTTSAHGAKDVTKKPAIGASAPDVKEIRKQAPISVETKASAKPNTATKETEKVGGANAEARTIKKQPSNADAKEKKPLSATAIKKPAGAESKEVSEHKEAVKADVKKPAHQSGATGTGDAAKDGGKKPNSATGAANRVAGKDAPGKDASAGKKAGPASKPNSAGNTAGAVGGKVPDKKTSASLVSKKSAASEAKHAMNMTAEGNMKPPSATSTPLRNKAKADAGKPDGQTDATGGEEVKVEEVQVKVPDENALEAGNAENENLANDGGEIPSDAGEIQSEEIPGVVDVQALPEPERDLGTSHQEVPQVPTFHRVAPEALFVTDMTPECDYQAEQDMASCAEGQHLLKEPEEDGAKMAEAVAAEDLGVETQPGKLEEYGGSAVENENLAPDAVKQEPVVPTFTPGAELEDITRDPTAESEENAFDPVTQWDRPLNLPSPVDEDEIAASGVPSASVVSTEDAALDANLASEAAVENSETAPQAANAAAVEKPANGKPANGRLAATGGKPPANGKGGKTGKVAPPTGGDRLNATTIAGPPPASKTIKKTRASLMPGELPSAVSGSNPAIAAGVKAGAPAVTKQPPIKKPGAKPVVPFYVDVAFIPCHGDNAADGNSEFFARVRARYYVLSSACPDPGVAARLVAAKSQWEDAGDVGVTLIPTHDSDELIEWIAANQELLERSKVEVAPSASRCSLAVGEGGATCSCYRVEL